MENKMQISAEKRLRGEILTLIHAVTPGLVGVRTLVNALIEGNYITNSNIAKPVYYLTEKGYITIVPSEEGENLIKGVLQPSTFLRLTAMGIDLVEGTIEDLGVDV